MSKAKVEGNIRLGGEEFYTKFVKCYKAASTVGEVADKLGITTQEVSRVAGQLRKHEIELPALGRQSKIDWNALQQLAKQ